MTERIEGKVARVNSDRELIINRGSEHGVEPDMVFRIKGSPMPVLDPDTDEEIGSISRVKVLVKVVEVDAKFCIARTFRSKRVNVGGNFEGYIAAAGLSGMLQPPKWETRYETLRRNPTEGERISVEDSIVSVGDVAELADDEDLDAAATTIWR